jgi:F0F1-type ATP synthase membrane subunit b/b'
MLAAESHFWHVLPALIVNFIILLGLFVYFGRKPIQAAFKQRSTDIERTVKKNNEAYAKLLEEFDRYGKQQEGLKSEHDELVLSVEKEGARLLKQAKDSAQKTTESYLQDVKETIKIETAELKRKLAVDLLDLSMEKLTKELKSSSEKLSHMYVDEFKKRGQKVNLTAV